MLYNLSYIYNISLLIIHFIIQNSKIYQFYGNKSSLYIIYTIIKNRQNFMNTSSLYQKQIIPSKKFFFAKKKFHRQNGSKDREEDATKHGWDICYRDQQETQKSPQSKEDQ